MWQLIKGVRSTSNLSSKNYALKLDGVNDYLSVTDSPFFNLGNGEFAIPFEIFILEDKVTSTALLQQPVIRKRTASSGAGYGFLSRYRDSTTNTVVCNYFQGGSVGNDEFFFPISNLPLGQWNRVVIQRKGNNTDDANGAGWATSVRNPANYEAWVNGVKIPWSIVRTNALGTNINLDNTDPFLIGAEPSLSGFWPFYVNYIAVYTKAFTESEIVSIANTGILPSANAKGVWNFGETFGSISKDSSSVGKNLSLIQKLGTTNMIPDEHSHIIKDGVIYYAPSQTQVVKTWVAPEDIKITKIIRSGTSSITYSTDGTNYNSITVVNNEAVVNITLSKGATLYLKATTSTAYGILQLVYSNVLSPALTLLNTLTFEAADQTGNYQTLPVGANRTLQNIFTATAYGTDAWNHVPQWYRKSDGTLYLAWNQGNTGEFDGTDRIVFKKSTDNGQTWGSLITAIPALSNLRTSIGTTKIRVNLIQEPFEFEGNFYMCSLVCEPGATNFFEPVVGILVAKVNANDTVDTPFWVYVKTSKTPTSGFPDYAYDSVLGPKIYNFLTGPNYQLDRGNDASELNAYYYGVGEPSNQASCDFYEFSRIRLGSSYARLSRKLNSSGTTNHWIQVADSYSSWGAPVMSNIPTSPQRPDWRVLNDNRVLTTIGVGSDRRYICIAISDQNSLKNRAANIYTILDNNGAVKKFEGQYKDGLSGYPKAIQIGNEILVAYSQWKEDIKLIRFNYPAIQPST